MNASTDREMTVFWGKVAKPHFKTAFAVLMDMVLHSRLEPEEGEKERENRGTGEREDVGQE